MTFLLFCSRSGIVKVLSRIAIIALVVFVACHRATNERPRATAATTTGGGVAASAPLAGSIDTSATGTSATTLKGGGIVRPGTGLVGQTITGDIDSTEPTDTSSSGRQAPTPVPHGTTTDTSATSTIFPTT